MSPKKTKGSIMFLVFRELDYYYDEERGKLELREALRHDFQYVGLTTHRCYRCVTYQYQPAKYSEWKVRWMIGGGFNLLLFFSKGRGQVLIIMPRPRICGPIHA